MDQKVFSLNSYKHHLLFVRQMIHYFAKKQSTKNIDLLLNEIRQIGNNVMDLYTGDLTVSEIIDSITFHLNNINFSNKKDYKKWLGPKEYKTIELLDHSVWILRLGTKDDAYIHIHPARYGSHIIRLTGSAWKSAIAVALLKNKIPANYSNILQKTNFVRSHFIDLAPVKKIVTGSNLDKALRLLVC